MALIPLFVCGMLLLAIPIAFLIGATILRGAVTLANMFVPAETQRSPFDEFDGYGDYRRPRYDPETSSVAIPVPGLGLAIAIILVTGLLNAIVGAGIAIAVDMSGAAAQMDGRTAQIVTQLVSLPFGFFTSAFVLSGMLPTSFLRGCLVTICQYAIVLTIAVVIGAIVFAVYGLQRGAGVG